MRDASKPDYYAILTLSPTATEFQIKSQYRRLSKQYHPDIGGTQADMAGINEAYRVLSDPFRRSIYDTERRHALHIPVREPAQPVYAPPRTKSPSRRQYTYSAKQPTPKRKRSWWTPLSWSFAIVVVLVGVLLQLPLAEATGSSDNTAQNTSKPLSVNYPSDNSTTPTTPSSPASTFHAVPSDTAYSAPAGSSAQPVQSQQQPPADTCSDDSCQQANKNCVTKTIGLFKHTICSSTGDSDNCTTHTIGMHRYTSCY